MAADLHDIDPDRTYLEITWWDHVFKPIVSTDCNNEKQIFYLIVGEDPCQTIGKIKGTVIPAAFSINKDACYVDQVIHYPLKLNSLLDSEFMLSFDTVKFLFSSSPVNYHVDINPFKTCIYRNHANDIILSFYAEDRDSGEWMSFDDMQPSHLKVINYSPSRFAADSCS